MILAHRRPVPLGRSEADDLSTPTELVAVTEGGRVDVLRRPPSGRSIARPIQSDDGVLAWYDLPRGGSTDLNFADAVLMVEGQQISSPWEVKPASIFAEYGTLGGRGHAEWLPDGRIVEAVLAQRRVGWWPWPLRQAWRCVTVDPLTGTLGAAMGDGWAEPSWHRTAGLVVAQASGRTVSVPGLGLRFDAPGLQVFDPYVSPDARYVVSLVRDRRWGLWLVDVATGVGRWLVDPTDTTVECSHARWDTDTSVICSMKLIAGPGSSAWYWRLVRVHLSGEREWLTGPEHGSVEQPFPVS